MSAEQQRLDQQAKIDAEVAASAATMRAHPVHEQSHDVRDHVLAHQQVTAGEDAFQQRVAVTEDLREQFEARKRNSAVVERAAQQREANSLLRSELLDARERELDAREQAVDQREIDAELASWPDPDSSSP